jgi:membrane protease YdiL (CAAX protease family)
MKLREDEAEASANWRATAGGLLLALSALPFVISAVARWPWHLLVPLLAYAVITAVVPPLRRTLRWARIGRLDGPILGVSAALAVASSAVLVFFDYLVRPDVSRLLEHLPLGPALPMVLAGAFFSVVNALLEELYFRGVLFDAFASQLGERAALIVQALAFGVGHANGYPPGAVGVGLATLYGLLLGVLRLWSGGLGASFLAHVVADATIFALVVRSS